MLPRSASLGAADPCEGPEFPRSAMSEQLDSYLHRRLNTPVSRPYLSSLYEAWEASRMSLLLRAYVDAAHAGPRDQTLLYWACKAARAGNIPVLQRLLETPVFPGEEGPEPGRGQGVGDRHGRGSSERESSPPGGCWASFARLTRLTHFAPSVLPRALRRIPVCRNAAALFHRRPNGRLDAGAELESGSLVLLEAVSAREKGAVRLLLEHPGVDINRPNLFGVSPLHQAVSTGDLGLVFVLLRRRPRWSGRTCEGETVLHAAARASDPRVAALVVSYCWERREELGGRWKAKGRVSEPEVEGDPRRDAEGEGDGEDEENEEKEGETGEEQEENAGVPPFSEVSHDETDGGDGESDLERCENAGIPVEQISTLRAREAGRRPGGPGARASRSAARSTMLSGADARGSPLNAQNCRGETPLHVAARYGTRAALEALLDSPFPRDTGIVTKAGQTVLHILASNLNWGSGRLRTPMSAVGPVSGPAASPAARALFLGAEERVAESTRERAGEGSEDSREGNAAELPGVARSAPSPLSPDSPPNPQKELTALIVSTISRLADGGLDIDRADAQGNTALSIAVLESNPRMVRALIASGARIDTRHVRGRTPLHLAAATYFESCTLALLNAGADINAQDDNGDTPCHLALRAGSQHNLRALLDRNARMDIRNCRGQDFLGENRERRARAEEKRRVRERGREEAYKKLESSMLESLSPEVRKGLSPLRGGAEGPAGAADPEEPGDQADTRHYGPHGPQSPLSPSPLRSLVGGA